MDKEYVMRGNSAILKCSIPSFVADFVHVVGWVDEEGHEFKPSSEGKFSGGKSKIITKTIPKSFNLIFNYFFVEILSLFWVWNDLWENSKEIWKIFSIFNWSLMFQIKLSKNCATFKVNFQLENQKSIENGFRILQFVNKFYALNSRQPVLQCWDHGPRVRHARKLSNS